MAKEDLVRKLSLLANLCLNSYALCRYFILYLHVWIRVRIGNTDLGPKRS